MLFLRCRCWHVPKLLKVSPCEQMNQLAFMLDPLLKGALHYLERDELAAMVARSWNWNSSRCSTASVLAELRLVAFPDIYREAALSICCKAKRAGHIWQIFIYNDWDAVACRVVVSNPRILCYLALIELLGRYVLTNGAAALSRQRCVWQI